MTRNEQQLYSDVTSIRESLQKIANALETNVPTTPKPKDIPGFEGTLDALGVLCDIRTITDDYSSKHDVDERDEDNIELQTDYLFNLIKTMTKEQYVKFYLEMDFGFSLSDRVAFTEHIINDLDYDCVLDCITSARNVLENSDLEDDHYDYHTNGNGETNEYYKGIVNDSDNDIRQAAYSYEAALDCETNYTSKKDCILDYVTNEFGILGARYTDIIKFAFYLGNPNSYKYTNANRGFYSCAFNTRFGGHLIKGGKDILVKGINKEGNERYFALSFVEQATEYWKVVR